MDKAMKSSRMLAGLLIAAWLLLGAPVRGNEREAFKVIVHPSNPVSQLTKGQVSKMFFKKLSRWESGQTVLPIDLAAGSETRKAFTKAIHRRSVSAVKSYWQQQIFSGRGVPPPEENSAQEVISFVAESPGAVGYVAADVPLEGVKAIQINY